MYARYTRTCTRPPVYISVRPRGARARAGRGGGWRSGWKCEDGTRGGAAKVRECYINRSGQCCYGNTTHSHAVGWMGAQGE